jgi:hypothetical protein
MALREVVVGNKVARELISSDPNWKLGVTKEGVEGPVSKEELTIMGHVISGNCRLNSFNFSILENSKDELMGLRELLTKEVISVAAGTKIVGLDEMGRLRGK